MKFRKITITFLLILSGSTFFAWAADNNIPAAETTSHTVSPDIKNPESLLGLTLQEAHAVFGIPNEISVHRDQNPDYDNIIFYYKEQSISLFWFQNRVWVVRIDSRSKQSLFGAAAGMKKEEVLKTLPYKYQEIDDTLVFFLKDQGFPVRLRLYFTKDIVSDIYLYRGDF